MRASASSLQQGHTARAECPQSRSAPKTTRSSPIIWDFGQFPPTTGDTGVLMRGAVRLCYLTHISSLQQPRMQTTGWGPRSSALRGIPQIFMAAPCVDQHTTTLCPQYPPVTHRGTEISGWNLLWSPERQDSCLQQKCGPSKPTVAPK